jgi:DNA-directed RNA polymerase specialized sigma24 family protein
MLATATLPDLPIFLSNLPVEEGTAVRLVYASGCSRRETADVMTIECDCVDVLLRDLRASAKLYYGVTSAHAHGIPPRT